MNETINLNLAFDIYGTLIDTNGVVVALRKCIGKQAENFSQTWRNKQLEYSFRRGLMQNYKDFAHCTKQALDYTCLAYKIELSQQEQTELMEIYRILPTFPDVKEGLEKAKSRGFAIYAFSNGHSNSIKKLLEHANIINYFIDIISVNELRTFKPNPAVYCHFLRSINAKSNNTYLISSNPFDVIGAISAGMYGVWLKRSEDAIFDPWEIKPNITINSLNDLATTLSTAISA